ncbi:FtsQ-type POTRA domain-containing protein [Streptomyces lunaelactis]|uniref:cell division protein FtsQ/DivIB n=1 Tax=Streptomyces lunaelactis TaxID=1535768 RepID=UPI0015856687|nr:FtsQ-type POTRA domain-containing protein [Streptomyces lunaelactis]NUK05012.1 FtsQ-type POTRA domain-containing protein [Streptomyces lunaelactis]NUK11365.1 FtsQ-type POTRA domain-containing protein [Streptomyces lunaelactis]NUK19065.1 FtsQ-type POTRA domain-containing protein [Streptomyces lunaelactis]NUK24877.1 FtsQ-type POTRA domain-containing protein [Streptomyces lunaelactis]NUK37822.1 FtsQ-type POTRA domain-containing protein [Streptomyces lunaelactis]
MAGPTTAERGARRPSDGADGSPLPPRQGRPARRLRLPGRRALLIAGAVIVLLAGGIWTLYGSEWLRVERVTTTGTEVLTPGEVEAAAAVPIKTPLISVDTDAIEARLRHKLPRIDSVDVVRSWPHGIGLRVTERKPVLLIEKGAKFIEVDAKGVRFATVDKAPKAVPLLELAVDQSPSLRRFGADRLLVEAVRVRGELPGKVAADTRTVTVRSYDFITLELSRDRTVVWGSPEEGEAKARALTALMKAAPKARHFDVSAPTAPAASGS